MISVCMATYNGEAYIQEQLNSILHQNRPVDQVIICDDRSSDKTVEICRRFIADNGLDNWSVCVNEHNVGFCLNFFTAIAKAQGDYIFLSDQDDVWHPDKTEKMCGVFEREPDVQVLSSRYDVIDGTGRRLDNSGVSYLGDTFDGSLDEVTLDSLIGCSYIRGFATAFRGRLKPYLKAIDLQSMMAHDWLINAVGCLVGRSVILNEKLVDYRYHDKNVSLSNMNRTTFLGDREKRKRGLAESVRGHRYLAEGGFSMSDKERAALCRMIKCEEKRLDFLTRKHFFTWLSLALYPDCYRRYYKSRKGGLRVWLGDFCYAYGIGAGH